MSRNVPGKPQKHKEQGEQAGQHNPRQRHPQSGEKSGEDPVQGLSGQHPCQSRAGITVAPDAADPALFAGNASHGDATVDW